MSRRLMVAAIALVSALSSIGCGEKEKKEELPRVPVGVNLVRNPSFEEWNGGIPAGWSLKEFEGTGKTMSICGKSSDEKVSGNFSFYMRGFYNVDRWLVLVQKQRVMPRYRLRFSAQMKGKDLKGGPEEEIRANIYVRFYDGKNKRVSERSYADASTDYLLGTSPWRRFSRRVDIPDNAQYAEIGCICQTDGWIWFDDVMLVLEEPIPWKEVKTKRIDFYYLEDHPLSKEAIEKQTAYVDKVIATLDLRVEDKLKYYYYYSEDKYRKLLNVRSGSQHVRLEGRELHTPEMFDDHDIVHLLLLPLGHPPFGLFEGIVFYFLGSWEGGRDLHMMAKEMLFAKELPPLHNLLKERDMDTFGMSKAVPAWSSFSIWLINHYGMKKFMELYVATKGLEEIDPFNAQFRTIYEKDFDALDMEWRWWVLRYDPKR